jgi:beta-barrel assembly-enhancing protease
MRKQVVGMVALAGLATALYGAINPPKPGWNLFSAQQDIQLGKEAAVEVEKQMPVVHNHQAVGYLRDIGQRLARSPHAGKWPYNFSLVAEKSVNAFALPGGPMYIHTGLITTAENEAQLAGVMAHEMAHVALRHGTNQASKANLIQIPAMIAGGMLGGNGGLLGGLAQLGVGLGANSVLMKFSRSAEQEADYLGALMMADAGYNPIEMARFFEKLEAMGGRSGVPTFLSSHPNPGDRSRRVQDVIQQLPRRNYATDSGQFRRMQSLVESVPPRGQLRGSNAPGGTAGPSSVPDIRPSSRMRQYQSSAYSLAHPDNWEVFGDQNSPSVTIAPRDALFQASGGGVQIGYGAMASYYMPEADRIDLARHTDELIRQLQQSNPGMQVQDRRNVRVDGQNAIMTTLVSRSPYQGEQEIDALVTVARPQGLFYVVFIAPQSEWRDVQGVFNQMLSSVRFSR